MPLLVSSTARADISSAYGETSSIALASPGTDPNQCECARLIETYTRQSDDAYRVSRILRDISFVITHQNPGAALEQTVEQLANIYQALSRDEITSALYDGGPVLDRIIEDLLKQDLVLEAELAATRRLVMKCKSE